ncbi:hypothetical protein CR513_13897, partial [Mucuna pruriens]
MTRQGSEKPAKKRKDYKVECIIPGHCDFVSIVPHRPNMLHLLNLYNAKQTHSLSLRGHPIKLERYRED